MKKNVSGFTLIELLAVIVVLAIVILMVENAGGVDKGGNSYHQLEIKQKGTENSVSCFIMYQNQQWTQIQRRTS